MTDGGPAFPSHGTMGEVAHEGMSLRDYYAGIALGAMSAGNGAYMVAATDGRYDGSTNWDLVVASNAWNFAETMLKMRDLDETERQALLELETKRRRAER